MFLLRVWGRDEAQVAATWPPDAVEDEHGALCYWFQNREARLALIQAIAAMPIFVVHNGLDPGPDDFGEVIEPLAFTVADVTLKLPDGRVGSYTDTFGYGYAEHSARFMYYEGNYSCDCNRSRFLSARCEAFRDLEEFDCGETIELVSFTVRKITRAQHA